MKSLFESLNRQIYENKVFEEYLLLESQEMINEAFKSSLLVNLAKEIQKVEAQHRENDKKEAERWKAQGYSGTPSKSERTFASIFGPLEYTPKYGGKKTGVQGIKWNEITDDDFKFYNDYDKNFEKLLKSIYSHKVNADIICCLQGTKTPKYVIKGYGKENTEPPKLYEFNVTGWNKGFKEKTATKYKYGERSLKYDEALGFLNDLDIYVLEITPEMIKNYQDLHTDRIESQKGIINFDKASLANILKKQQARYRVLVAEMKAKKLQSDPEEFFEEIKKTNDDVVKLYEKIMSKPEYLDQRFNLRRLMDYVASAYDNFYESIKSTRKADVLDMKHPGNHYDWDRESAKTSINKSKEYIDEVKKMIKEIEDEL